MITHRNNIQMMDDFEMFDWLISLMITNINFSSNLSKSNKLNQLKTWILDKTFHIFGNSKTTLGNRIFYIINDIHQLPHCKTCGKKLNTEFTAYSTIYDYENSFCDSSCAVSNPDVRHKIEQTMLKNHGYISSFSDPNVRIQIKQTNLDRYGVEYSMQCKEIANKVAMTNLNTYGCISVFGNKEIREKIIETWKTNYGVDNPLKSPEIQAKIHEKHRTNYGVDYPFQSKEIQHKGKMTRLDKYGSTSYLGTIECLKKTQEWSINMYGVDHHFKSPEVRAEIENTNMRLYGNKAGKAAFGTQYFKDAMLNIYGVDHPSKCKDILDKSHFRYTFDNNSFDSAPEIAFYIWLKDNAIPFEYQPDVSFSYTFDGKEHRYFPDFKIGDMLFEIKGDHFFKDGKMICPYRDKTWSDEQYLLECSKYEAKHQCMLKNDVIIMTSNEYAMFEEYVSITYGKDFLKNFKNHK